jgi:putative membrane protein
MSTHDLPTLNAVLNASSTVLILGALAAIRAGNSRLHGKLMVAALASSTLFLAGYLVHKALHGTTTSGHMGSFRPYYLGLLGSHTVLAIVNLPLVIGTVLAAARGNWERHRRWARFTWPVWLYVSVTGVLVYLILYVWYPAPA